MGFFAKGIGNPSPELYWVALPKVAIGRRIPFSYGRPGLVRANLTERLIELFLCAVGKGNSALLDSVSNNHGWEQD